MKYDISVIIPFYNNERFLDDAVNSVIKQKYDFSKIEIILVNDCSTDNSLDVAKKYAKYNNIKIINKKKNEGVSKARNDGIKIATGKYIMLLDGDDYISSNTISDLVSFFGANENEVDLVTYPIFLQVNNSKPSKQEKYNYYKEGTGIYDLEKYPYVNQTTINIVFKNDKKHFFDEKLRFAEDQKFNTSILMKKGKIGFCESAQYFYRRHGGGVSQTLNNFYYCYDDIIRFLEWLVNSYLDKKEKKLPKYIQIMILNTFNWRFKSDLFFPYFLEGKEYDEALKRIFKLLTYVEITTIYNFPAMTFYDKYYFIKQKTDNLKLKVNGGCLEFWINDIFFQSYKYLKANIKRNKIFNNTLFVKGTLVEPFLELQKPNLYLVVKKNDKIERKKIELYESRTSYNKSRVKINHVHGFDFELDLKDVQTYGLELEIDGTIFKVQCFDNYFATNKKITREYICNYRSRYFNYNVKKCTLKNKFKYYVSYFVRNFKKYPKISLFKILSRVIYNKKSWLYYDNNNLDNGYYQFIHDIEIKDGIKKYYVCDNQIKKSIDKKYHKNIIKFNGIKHKFKYLNATKIFVSNSSLITYCPFKDYRNIKDILNYQLIYLQHGVLHANLSFLYNKENTEIDKITISSEFERENLIKNYGYKTGDLILSGMSRFDIKNKELSSSLKNKILFAPSWRIYLATETKGSKRIGNIKSFKESNYYKNLKEFFKNPKLLQVLEEHNLTIDVKLHPNFDTYNECIDFLSERINLKRDIELQEYKMLITDFSSFQFDFIDYMRPIIYFIPDKDEFNAGLHTYRELDLKSDMNFANTYFNSNELINEIRKIVKNDFKVSFEFKERMKKFFSYDRNKSCRDAIYNYVKE